MNDERRQYWSNQHDQIRQGLVKGLVNPRAALAVATALFGARLAGCSINISSEQNATGLTSSIMHGGYTHPDNLIIPCIDPDGNMLGVGSTRGENTCVSAFDDTDGKSSKRFSTFTWKSESGAPIVVCKSAKILSSGTIIDFDTVENVGHSCEQVKGTPEATENE